MPASPAGAGNISCPRPVILFVVTEDWYFWTHRSGLAAAARAAGYDVALAARFTQHRERIEAAGVRCYPLALQRATRNPLADLAALFVLVRVIKTSGACLVHAVALKPILLCLWSLLRFPRLRFCFAVTGLGHLFIAGSPGVRMLRTCLFPFLRRLMTHPSSVVIFQNEDDRVLLAKNRLVKMAQTRLIRGAGVDTARYVPTSLPITTTPLVVMPSRVLRDKGVIEFIEAAGILHRQGLAARFALVGALDEASPTAIKRGQLEALCGTHGCEWWQHREDMTSVYAEATVVCLPSYREGLPKALLEAASCARPLVATDVPGCREICRNDENGLLVPPRNAQALASALARLLVDPGLCLRMGLRAREIVEQEFSAEMVHAQTISLYREICPP